jgi:hypothetical protein
MGLTVCVRFRLVDRSRLLVFGDQSQYGRWILWEGYTAHRLYKERLVPLSCVYDLSWLVSRLFIISFPVLRFHEETVRSPRSVFLVTSLVT